MSSPKTARNGIIAAGGAMLVATLATFFTTGLSNFALMALGIVVGGGLGYVAAKRVAMTDMPQMVAIYNGMGGGAAGAIAGVELLNATTGTTADLSVVGGLIGGVSFAGSVIAFLKLQGWMPAKAIAFPGQQPVNVAVLGGAVVAGILVLAHPVPYGLLLFFALALGYGLLMTVPIGGADMPVVISLYNALTGIAVGIDGFALSNYATVIAGTLVEI